MNEYILIFYGGIFPSLDYAVFRFFFRSLTPVLRYSVLLTTHDADFYNKDAKGKGAQPWSLC